VLTPKARPSAYNWRLRQEGHPVENCAPSYNMMMMMMIKINFITDSKENLERYSEQGFGAIRRG